MTAQKTKPQQVRTVRASGLKTTNFIREVNVSNNTSPICLKGTEPTDHSSDSLVQRQAAIENALSTALHYVRHACTQQAIQAATSKAIRAASLLKQACAELATSGVAV